MMIMIMMLAAREASAVASLIPSHGASVAFCYHDAIIIMA